MVAQTSGLLYRRPPVCKVNDKLARPSASLTADWKSALQQAGSLRYTRVFVCKTHKKKGERFHADDQSSREAETHS